MAGVDPNIDPVSGLEFPWKKRHAEPPPENWFLHPDWFEFVYNTADSDLRAHRIALSYYNLASHLDSVLNNGVSPSVRAKDPLAGLNVNWFHFAMWGTLTVTQNVSNQRAPQRLNSGVPAPLRRRITPAILRARATDGQRVGRALAWGQLAIFVSATQILLEMLNPKGPLSEGTVTPEIEQAMAKSVNDRLVKIGASDAITLGATRHIVPMTRAFGYYKKAMTTSGVTQAWLTLGANLLLTAAEQDLADIPVEVVLDHIPQHVGAAINWRLAKLSERLRGVPPNVAFAVLESMHPNQRKVISTIWSRLMTDQVLVMALPTETLRLGRDIPPKHREWPLFPPDLRNIPDVNSHDPKTVKDFDGNLVQLKEIVNLVKSMDRTIAHSGTRGSAARDWRRWDERMNWALALIRSRQQDETLFWSPYSIADQWNIVNGEMPTRVADASTLDVQAPTDRILIALAPTDPPR